MDTFLLLLHNARWEKNITDEVVDIVSSIDVDKKLYFESSNNFIVALDSFSLSPFANDDIHLLRITWKRLYSTITNTK